MVARSKSQCVSQPLSSTADFSLSCLTREGMEHSKFHLQRLPLVIWYKILSFFPHKLFVTNSWRLEIVNFYNFIRVLLMLSTSKSPVGHPDTHKAYTKSLGTSRQKHCRLLFLIASCQSVNESHCVYLSPKLCASTQCGLDIYH